MSEVVRYRERIEPRVTTIGQSWFTVNGIPYGRTNYSLPSGNLTVERTWDHTNPGPPYRSGWPFHTIKVDNAKYRVQGTADRSIVASPGSPIIYYYSGGFIPSGWTVAPSDANLNSAGIGGTYGSDFGKADSYGADAWNRFKPKLSFADVAVFIGEFRDTPRMLKTSADGFRDIWKTMGGRKSASLSPRGAAGHFLNHQFGWLPFLSDLKRMLSATQRLSSLINQSRRDNNKWIHRGGTIETQNNVTDRIFSPNSPGLYPALGSTFYQFKGGSYGRSYRYTKTTSRVWFEGAFKYYIPWLAMPNRGVAKAMNYLRAYGALVNPAVLWELVPWSWLVDWSTNAGSVIDNFTSMLCDNMVAKYAFVMKTTEVRFVFDTVTYFKSGDLPLVWNLTLNVKSRSGADPLGFGLTWDNYTPRQLAILGALGISRLK